jgi:XisI protein
MDKILRYEKIILDILKPYASIRYANINAQNELIADKENHRYQIVTIGWDNDIFIHDCPIHIDIINEKIWVQRNMTELDLDEAFAKNNIPKQDIVIGFLSPKMREYTEYAAA